MEDGSFFLTRLVEFARDILDSGGNTVVMETPWDEQVEAYNYGLCSKLLKMTLDPAVGPNLAEDFQLCGGHGTWGEPSCSCVHGGSCGQTVSLAASRKEPALS